MPKSSSPTVDPDSMRRALARGRREHARAVRGTFAGLARVLTSSLLRRRQRFVVVPRGISSCRTC